MTHTHTQSESGHGHSPSNANDTERGKNWPGLVAARKRYFTITNSGGFGCIFATRQSPTGPQWGTPVTKTIFTTSRARFTFVPVCLPSIVTSSLFLGSGVPSAQERIEITQQHNYNKKTRGTVRINPANGKLICAPLQQQQRDYLLCTMMMNQVQGKGK